MKLNCNKKKGFTLIELLAVIVILAIIAVIATPIITGIIEDSKKASFERSAEGVVEATKFDIPEKLTETGYTYEFENGENREEFNEPFKPYYNKFNKCIIVHEEFVKVNE